MWSLHDLFAYFCYDLLLNLVILQLLLTSVVCINVRLIKSSICLSKMYF